MMKKVMSVLLAAAAVLSLAACGAGGEEGGAASNTAKVIDVDLTNEEYAFGVDRDQPELLEQVNTFIAAIQEDGRMDEVFNNYFGDGEPQPVESAALDTSKEQLVVATNAEFEPFEYMEGNYYYGIDMEIAAMLAEELGMELVIQNMQFDAVCLSVGQHTCDIAMAGLTVNAEREEYVTFSDSYYQASQRLIVPASDTTFDECTTADEVVALLNELTAEDVIGVQVGTTGQYYVEGDAEWGFDGLPATCTTYRNGSLAVQDMLNGNIRYVIIDAAPAAAITESINAMQ